MVARNLRFVIALVALIAIVGIIATSHSDISTQIKKVQEKAGDSIPFSDEESNSNENTFQGKPHKGSEAPYSPDKVAGVGKVEDIEGAKGDAKKPDEGKYAIKPSTGSASVGKDGKPIIVADTTDSSKSHADKNKPGSSDDELKADTKALEEQVTSGKKTSSKGANCDERNYVVMIDAGSTGSRVHVYEFNTCQSPPVLIKETFEMLKPGLSSFDTDTIGAAKSLDPLLKVALEAVPKDKQGCTPVAVKATAGLRLLGEEKSTNILKEVRNHLENDFPFAVVDGDGISIMEGKDEGVYAWITTNYLLGNIGSSEKTPTAAVFDLGGGSTQIVFEPDFTHDETMVSGDHKYKLNFGNREFTLYQYSHLGYGLMQGRNKVNSLIVESALKKNTELASSKKENKKDLKGAKATITLNNPCIPPGVVAEDVEVELGKNEFYLVNMKGPAKENGVHSGAQCRFLAEKVLNKESECTEKPCSFNGIYQPSLNKSFKKSNDMFVFSYFYDRTNPLGFPNSFTVEELSELAKLVCGGETFWADVLLDDHIEELNKEPQWCLDLSFITAMLHTGYDIPLQRELRTAKTINDNELGWCLGASLPLLDKSSGWTCRVKEVAKDA